MQLTLSIAIMQVPTSVAIMLVVLSATLMLVDLFVAVMTVLQTSEFCWPSENVKIVKVKTGGLGGVLSSLLGVLGREAP